MQEPSWPRAKLEAIGSGCLTRLKANASIQLKFSRIVLLRGQLSKSRRVDAGSQAAKADDVEHVESAGGEDELIAFRYSELAADGEVLVPDGCAA